MAHRADGLNDIFEHDVTVRGTLHANNLDAPALDATYLRLDCSNGPLTGDLDTGTHSLFVGNKLGIGTLSPQTFFHVVGAGALARFERNTAAVGASFNQFYNTNTTDGNTADIVWLIDTTGTGAASAQQVVHIRPFFEIHDHATRATRLEFGTSNGTASSTKMTIKGDGKVGIGIVAPEAKLHIYDSNVAATPYSATQIALEDNGEQYIEFLADAGEASGQGILWSDGALSGRLLYFHTDDSLRIFTTATEKLRITTGGNVGIGVTVPNEKLEVNGKIRANTAFNINGTDGVSGSFTTVDLKTVTVTKGIITAIV